jgi:hypothetical protein
MSCQPRFGNCFGQLLWPDALLADVFKTFLHRSNCVDLGRV